MTEQERAKEIFLQAGLPLYDTPCRLLAAYQRRLLEANRQVNLTAIIEPEEIWRKHFLDSAILLQKTSIPLDSACLDVGTGAGFPGLVLAIFRPDLKMTLLDSLQKRIVFLEETAAELGLSNVCCIHARAEDAAKDDRLREMFDFVTARAVAPLPVLLEYCLPFVKCGGVCALMKGPAESAASGATAAARLGGGNIKEISYALEHTGKRKLMLVKKETPTPPAYPRRGDKIKKNPL